ncbi:MAG: hypothetical protein RSA79_01600 [Oscillospiraceae bacterium]
MQRIEVKVCVCTQCVMNGAMDIVSSIEGLQKLKNQLRFHTAIKVDDSKCLCPKNSSELSPLVLVNNARIERATSEIVTAKIISDISKLNDENKKRNE